MANTIRQVLNAQGLSLPLFCGGLSRIGIGVSGVWTGQLNFEFSVDGLTFYPMSVAVFALDVGQQFTTVNGNFYVAVKNFIAARCRLVTLTSGAPVVIMSASVDSSYQDAFLASTSHFVNQASSANSGNVVTQPAQANRAWRLRYLNISVSGTAVWAASPAFKISDGASAVLWAGDLPTAQGQNTIGLPEDPKTAGLSGGGVVGTPGNSMVVTVAAAGSGIITNVNAEFIPQ
jgi:hypothetical protein